MITDEQRKAFEQWVTSSNINLDLCISPVTDSYLSLGTQLSWEAWQAAQQEPAQAVPLNDDYVEYQVWRSTDSCMECWSWDECDKEDYDKAHPTARRIIKVISHDV